MLIIARDNTVDDISHHDLVVSLTGESPETNFRPLRLHGTLVYRTARTQTIVQISPDYVLVCQPPPPRPLQAWHMGVPNRPDPHPGPDLTRLRARLPVTNTAGRFI